MPLDRPRFMHDFAALDAIVRFWVTEAHAVIDAAVTAGAAALSRASTDDDRDTARAMLNQATGLFPTLDIARDARRSIVDRLQALDTIEAQLRTAALTRGNAKAAAG